MVIIDSHLPLDQQEREIGKGFIKQEVMLKKKLKRRVKRVKSSDEVVADGESVTR